MVLIIENALIIMSVLICIILILIFITGNNKKSYIVREFYSLGTSNQLKVYGKRAEKAIEESIKRIYEIDNKMSVFKEDSEISKINKHAGNKPHIVSKDTYYVIQKAIKYCSLSKGTFDITIGPIVGLWGIGKEDGTPWNVGIQDPIKTRGEFALTIGVINKSVVTSGNYERYFEQDGKRFHHIINPSTGFPSESDIVSATIISDNSIDGDGLSTGVYIMGVQKAIKLIEEIDGVDAIFITKNKEVYVTSGMREKFTITSDEFVYKNVV